MKANFKIIAVVTFIIAVLASCNQMTKKRDPLNSPSHVVIKAVNGKYNFYVNGELFDLKGVGGGGKLSMLHEAGGNSLRTWGANNGKQLLDTAYKYNIMVAMGLGMGQELHNFDYNDTAAVGQQFREIKKAVDAYKNHPNLLCWVAGNELNLSPTRSIPVNPKVYDALKEVVDYVHKADPIHPITTTFAGTSKEHIKVALEHCPDLDFLSLQVYGGLARIPELVKAAEITKPYAITEFGPKGHWEMPRTEWGREIEETSAAKASGLWDRIQKGIVSDPTGLCLGGYAFLWGQKQERTPTWYGMFIKSGEATAIVDELTRYWTGKYPDNQAPKVDSLKLAGKNAVDNIYLKPGVPNTAKVFASDPDNDPLTFKWVVLKEVIERSQGGARELEPDSFSVKILAAANGEIKFVAPSEKGEYRLFSYVFDGKMKVGTANVPFYVK